jgi:hypothetical protein
VGLLTPRADCDTCSHATIQSLIIDGNRPQLLRIPKGGALIETGNGEGQTVKNCRLYEPRLVTLLLEAHPEIFYLELTCLNLGRVLTGSMQRSSRILG